MNLHGDLTYQSDETYTQQAFNSFVQDFGIEIDEDSVTENIEYMRAVQQNHKNERTGMNELLD